MNEPVAARKPAAEELLAIVQQLAAETHPGHAVKVHLRTSFERDLGLDSLARVELMLRIGKSFGIELPPEALSDADTPDAVLRLLGQAPSEQTPSAGTSFPDGRAAGLPHEAATLLDVLE